MGNFLLYLCIGLPVGLTIGFVSDFRRLVLRSLFDNSGD